MLTVAVLVRPAIQLHWVAQPALNWLQTLSQGALLYLHSWGPMWTHVESLRKSHMCTSFCDRPEHQGYSISEVPLRLQCVSLNNSWGLMSFFKQLLLKLLHKTKRVGPCEYFVFADLFEQQFGRVPGKTEKEKRKEKQNLGPSSRYSASMPSTLPISKIKQVTSEAWREINRARPWIVWTMESRGPH